MQLFSKPILYFQRLIDPLWSIVPRVLWCLLGLSTGVQALEPVTLQLKYLHQFQFAGYYAAHHQGYYRDAGLQVDIVEGIAGNEPELRVLSGEADFGVGSSSLLLSRAAGRPLVVMAVMFQHSPYRLLVPADQVPRGILDLAGKRVMISAQADELVAFLKIQGVPLDSLVPLEHSFKPEDLINGKVDAFSAYSTNETNYLEQQGFDFFAYNPQSAGIDFYGDNLFTSEQLIAARPDLVKRFREASIRGWQYALSHPEETVDLILEKYTRRKSRDELLYEMRQMMPLIQPVLVEIGYMNPVRWRHIAETYAELGMLPSGYQFDGFLYDPDPQVDLTWLYLGLAILGSLLLFASIIHFSRLARERNRAREEMAFKNIMLSTQQEASRDGLLAVDGQGGVVTINQRFVELWGLPADIESLKADNKLLSVIVDKVEEPEAFLHRVTEVYRQKHLISSEEIILRDGRIFDRYTAPMIGPQGQYYGRLWSFRDITERKEAEQLIWQQANYDFLTGLPNRHMLHDRLQQELIKAERNGQQVALLFLDLDRFKEVNDTLGHDMGDLLIQDTARRLSSCVRQSDTIARLGGDEFTLILGGLEESDHVERVAQDILKRLSEPFHLQGEEAYISSSIGITFYPDDGRDVETLLKHADQAMYAAKERGRNCAEYFTAAMQEQAIARRQLANDLRQALANQEFLLHYQPIVDLASGEIYKAEALIRWQQPQRGMVNPVDFIGIAEETGMIIDIGNWVFREATRQISQWRRQGHDSFQVSINASPVQFRSEVCEQQAWFEHLDALGLPGQAVVVEITEGLLMDVSQQVQDKLLGFRDARIHVALDDFGTGYSSLSYLKRFDIDFLKIDQSFVRNLGANAEDMALCEAIIVMAHKLGIKVIAEGVETEQQRQLLADAGCDFAQGYLFSKPVPAAEFELLLAGCGERRELTA